MKEYQLQENYEMSQSQIGEKIFLRQQTIAKIEKRAIEKFKKELSDRGISLDDLL
jgi:DNA-binding XRE family transcriptional regulator